jgi:hypothetical protein
MWFCVLKGSQAEKNDCLLRSAPQTAIHPQAYCMGFSANSDKTIRSIFIYYPWLARFEQHLEQLELLTLLKYRIKYNYQRHTVILRKYQLLRRDRLNHNLNLI